MRIEVPNRGYEGVNHDFGRTWVDIPVKALGREFTMTIEGAMFCADAAVPTDVELLAVARAIAQVIECAE